VVTSQDIITDAQSIQHGPLPSNIEEDKLMHVPPDCYYWVVLQVELTPVGCRSVYSEPIRTRAAVSPDSPVIRLEVGGLKERRRLEKRICDLSNKRDRFSSPLNFIVSVIFVLTLNKVVSRGYLFRISVEDSKRTIVVNVNLL